MKELSREATKHYDVIVVGGGLAGVCAAVSAARHGAKAAIIQDRPMFGGMSSSEQRQHVVGASCHNTKKDVAETGIIHEILLANELGISIVDAGHFKTEDIVISPLCRKLSERFGNTGFTKSEVCNDKIKYI